MIKQKNNVTILGIETSCDDTSVAVVNDGRYILSNIISSQIDIHKKFGGVVPEVASRNHINDISYVVDEALSVANVTFDDIDAIAVTYAPGLEGALLVGLSYGKALSYSLQKPLIGVHHIEGHICANYLENDNVKPPFIALVVSGGHTNLVHVKDFGNYEILGKTRDDAAGEAYDKVARVLGLTYPGGPKIDKLSLQGDPLSISFPSIMLEKNSLDFSFSGLKSAVLNYVNSNKMKNIPTNIENVAACFQKSVVDVLVKKTLLACEVTGCTNIVLAGGVASNNGLRNRIIDEASIHNYTVNIPPPVLCTDNGAMIASCGYFKYIGGEFADLSLNAIPNLKLGN